MVVEIPRQEHLPQPAFGVSGVESLGFGKPEESMADGPMLERLGLRESERWYASISQ